MRVVLRQQLTLEREDEVYDEGVVERGEDLHFADDIGDGLLLQTLAFVGVLHGVHLIVALPAYNANLPVGNERANQLCTETTAVILQTF